MMEFSIGLLSLLLIVTNVINIVSTHSDSFDEELLLKPLPSGHVYAYFQFTTLWHIPKNSPARESTFLNIQRFHK